MSAFHSILWLACSLVRSLWVDQGMRSHPSTNACITEHFKHLIKVNSADKWLTISTRISNAHLRIRFVSSVRTYRAYVAYQISLPFGMVCCSFLFVVVVVISGMVNHGTDENIRFSACCCCQENRTSCSVPEHNKSRNEFYNRSDAHA